LLRVTVAASVALRIFRYAVTTTKASGRFTLGHAVTVSRTAVAILALLADAVTAELGTGRSAEAITVIAVSVTVAVVIEVVGALRLIVRRNSTIGRTAALVLIGIAGHVTTVEACRVGRAIRIIAIEIAVAVIIQAIVAALL
jgi:hypothetical protein